MGIDEVTRTHRTLVAATLRRLLEESGDPVRLADLDLDTWVARWMGQPLTELGNLSPAEVMLTQDGEQAVVRLLERMRGGLPG